MPDSAEQNYSNVVSPRELSDELLRAVFDYVPAAASGAIAGSVFLMAWLWQRTDSIASTAWLAVAVALNLGALGIWTSAKHAGSTTLQAKGRQFLVVRAMAGLNWGIGVLLVGFTSPLDNLWMLIAVWAGLAVACVPVMSGLKAAVHWFVFPAAIAFVTVLLAEFTPFRGLVALAVAALALVIYLLTCRTYQVLRRGLRASLSNDVSRQTIASQASELTQLLKERDKLQAMKDQFVAAASHDLRQPAQAISLLAKNIHDVAKDPELSTQTSALIRASDQINDLLNTLLDTARLDMTRDKPELQWISLPVIFSRLAPALQVKAVNHGVSLVFSQERYSVYSDPMFVERIVQNLLNNAIEHSQGDQVTVEFDTEQGETGALTMLLIDNGNGLDPAAVAVVNSASSDDTRVQSGDSFSVHGMGLLIASRLARIAGHQLSVETQRDSGTEFKLAFDTWRHGGAVQTTVDSVEGLRDEALVKPPPMLLHRPGILIIDDNALVRVGLSAVASNAGYNATVVGCVDEALDAIVERDESPEAIMVDWHLGDGITAADIVPELQAALTAPIPVVVLTGELSLEYSERALSAMFGNIPVRILTKPVATSMLKRTLVDLLAAPRALPAGQGPASAMMEQSR